MKRTVKFFDQHFVQCFILSASLPLMVNCTNSGLSTNKNMGTTASGQSAGQPTLTPGSTPASGAVVAGNGSNIAGTGNLTVATNGSIPFRIANGLQNKVSPASGNFAKALTQVQNNLPASPDITKSAGFDQLQLLIYAACSDLTTGGTNSPMQSATGYHIVASGSVVSNQAALISAGTSILDQHLGGLASQGPAAAAVTQNLTTLVTALSQDSTINSQMAFVSVCIAASSAGFIVGF